VCFYIGAAQVVVADPTFAEPSSGPWFYRLCIVCAVGFCAEAVVDLVSCWQGAWARTLDFAEGAEEVPPRWCCFGGCLFSPQADAALAARGQLPLLCCGALFCLPPPTTKVQAIAERFQLTGDYPSSWQLMHRD